MTTFLEEGLFWQGPVVWWNPVDGWRHAFAPDRKPQPEQERVTLCGQAVVLIDPSELDWLAPTCDVCMNRAKEWSQQRQDAIAERRRDQRRQQGWL